MPPGRGKGAVTGERKRGTSDTLPQPSHLQTFITPGRGGGRPAQTLGDPFPAHPSVVSVSGSSADADCARRQRKGTSAVVEGATATDTARDAEVMTGTTEVVSVIAGVVVVAPPPVMIADAGEAGPTADAAVDILHDPPTAEAVADSGSERWVGHGARWSCAAGAAGGLSAAGDGREIRGRGGEARPSVGASVLRPLPALRGTRERHRKGPSVKQQGS